MGKKKVGAGRSPSQRIRQYAGCAHLTDHLIPKILTGLNKSLLGPHVDRLSHDHNHLSCHRPQGLTTNLLNCNLWDEVQDSVS